jgi:hypothetical protein
MKTVFEERQTNIEKTGEKRETHHETTGESLCVREK